MKKRKIDFRHLSTLAVLLISLCALVVSIRQTSLLSEQQKLMTKAEKAQLWPRISIKSKSVTTKGKYKRFEFSIINVGVGPAIIESFEIMYKEELIGSFLGAYKMSTSQKAFTQSLQSIEVDNGLLFSAQVIPAEETILLFAIEVDTAGEVSEMFDLYTGANQPQVKIVYRSVFDDMWQIESKMVSYNTIPKAINTN